MINTIKNALGFGPKIDFKELVINGGQIIDVRTRQEYASGNVIGSVNIPLNELTENLSKIKKDKPVITCCASGMRSASAKSILINAGFSEVHNAGGWMSLNGKL
jgi:phage shock protein E